ncbi:MAG: purine-nucleoside phosphorylase [Planctomycetes bacterium]|nr:purine-nucleoside phosphorylase [Planctomycetota bacterium]MBI3844484.1 purine-nucleoside phosphorylase [Planctomycetota bacterium]
MTTLREKVEKAADLVRDRSSRAPEFGIILGTGLSALAKEISSATRIPYKDIPGFPVPTAIGHGADLVLGEIEGRSVAAMEGRFHFYEGYSLEQVTFPVRVLRALGAKFLIVSNAAGGMNPLHRAGDLVLIDDHVNLMGVNPLVGPNDERLGPRFPDMSEPYDRALLELAEQIAIEEGIRAHRGVLVAVTGPSLETRAEYRFLRAIGADVVSMSTVPEVIVAAHAGCRVLGVSVITDRCLPDALKPVDIDEIIEVANTAEPKLARLMKRVIREARP